MMFVSSIGVPTATQMSCGATGAADRVLAATWP